MAKKKKPSVTAQAIKAVAGPVIDSIKADGRLTETRRKALQACLDQCGDAEGVSGLREAIKARLSPITAYAPEPACEPASDDEPVSDPEPTTSKELD